MDVMDWLVPSVIASLISSCLLTFIFLFLCLQEKEPCFCVWSISWFFYTLRFIFLLFSLFYPDFFPNGLLIAVQISSLLSGFLMLMGTYLWLQSTMPRHWIVLTGICAVWVTVSSLWNTSYLVISLPSYFFMGGIYIWTGYQFIRQTSLVGCGKYITGYSFIVWGIHKIDYPFLRSIDWIAPYGFLLSSVLTLLVSFGFLIAYFEKSKKQVSESEKRYRSLFENNHAVMLLIQPETGQIVDANPAACVFYGYSRHEFKTKRIQDINLLSLEQIKQEMFNAAAYKKNHFNFQHRLSNGKIRDVEVFCGPIEVHGQSLLYSLVFDVTDRIHLERSLKESEHRFRTSLLNTPFPVMIHAEDGQVIFVNNRWTEITGYQYHEINTIERWTSLAYRDKQAKVKEDIEKTYDIDLYHDEGEYEIITKHGEKRIWDFRSASIGRDSLNRRLVISTALDVTEKKQVERGYIEQTEILQSILDHAPIMTTFNKPDGSHRWVNRCLENTLGWTLNEIKNNDIYKEMYPDPLYREQVIRFIKNASQQWAEFKIRTKHGQEIDTQWINIPLSDGSIIGIGLDITEKKRFELEKDKMRQQLYQAQKMEAIGTLAGGIAHDFNNILGSLFGYIELVLFDSDRLDPLHREYLNYCLEAAERAKHLVQQILTFSRKNESEKQPVQIGLIVKEAARLLRASTPSTIEFLTDISSSEATVMANSTQIHQIIMNLGTNAIHAIGNHPGAIEIKLFKTDLDKQFVERYPNHYPGSYLCLQVSDTGCGIEPEIIERIFEPFFTTKHKSEGTGLGLSVVHGIVDSHNGIILINSEVGVGTTFHIYFPVIDQETTEFPAEKNRARGNNEAILLIDDEYHLLKIGSRMLSDFGYRVVSDLDPLNAFSLFEQNPDRFDLIISDQTMPNLTGVELAKRIKNIRPDLPFILCTGYSSGVSYETVQEAGIDELVFKPIEWNDFSVIVHNVLQGAQRKLHVENGQHIDHR